MEQDDIGERLAAVFDPREIRWKPQSVRGNRALAIAYISARTVMDRLDEVVGVTGWQDSYEVQADGTVMCRLAIRVNGEWLTKVDVGGRSEQPDEGDKAKAAVSDALKRTAVHWGVGRYIYNLPQVWCDYDVQKKQFTTAPQLPNWAIPKQKSAPAQPAKGAAERKEVTGPELHARLREKDAKLAAAKLCSPGALLVRMAQEGVKAGYGDDISRWPSAAMPFAIEIVKAFEAAAQPDPKPTPAPVPTKPQPQQQTQPPVFDGEAVYDEFLMEAANVGDYTTWTAVGQAIAAFVGASPGVLTAEQVQKLRDQLEDQKQWLKDQGLWPPPKRAVPVQEDGPDY